MLQAYPDIPELVVDRATMLDNMPLEERRGWLREFALYGAVLSKGDPDLVLLLEREIAELLTYGKAVGLLLLQHL